MTEEQEIMEIQKKLNAILGTDLAIDGIIGPETTDAIISFQEQANLDADGIYGPKTQAALDTAWAQQANNMANDTSDIVKKMNPFG